MGRYCSYLLPKQAGGTTQIIIFKTLQMIGRPALYVCENANVIGPLLNKMSNYNYICVWPVIPVILRIFFHKRLWKRNWTTDELTAGVPGPGCNMPNTWNKSSSLSSGAAGCWKLPIFLMYQGYYPLLPHLLICHAGFLVPHALFPVDCLCRYLVEK